MPLLETELTSTQQELLNVLWTTETVAPVGRRRLNPDGTYGLYKVERPSRPIDFPALGAEDEEFALKLHETNIKAPLSPYYINLRNLPDNVLQLVARVIAESILDKSMIHQCTGIPSAGVPIGETFSQVTRIPYRDVLRKTQTDSGRQIMVDSHVRPVNRPNLLIIDDLITEAGTKFEAIEAAESLGYKIAGVAVLVDRQQGGVEQLEARDYKVFAPLPVSEVFKYYLLVGKIDQSRYDNSMNYLNTARASVGLSSIPLLP